MVELHRGESVTKGATPSSFFSRSFWLLGTHLWTEASARQSVDYCLAEHVCT